MGNGARIDLRRTREYAEVRAQPESWSGTLDLAEQFVPGLARLVEQAGADAGVVFTGCGVSYQVAVSAAGLYQEATGGEARAVPAGDMVLAPTTVFARGRRYAVVGLSRTGETSETLAAVRRAASEGHAVAAITGRAGSALAEAVPVAAVLSHAGGSAARWAGNLLLAVQLWAAVSGRETWRQELLELPAAGDAGLDFWAEVAEELAGGPAGRHWVFLGTGAYYGLALAGCRRLRSLAPDRAEAHHTLEYRHGALAGVTPDTLAVLSAQRRCVRQEADVLADIARAGGRTVAMAEGAQTLRAWLGIDMGSGLSDWARAPLHLLPLQLMALARGVACGHNPDGAAGTAPAL